MNNNKPYTTLEIPGSFLVPGFCIYVLEIIKEEQKWFYIGMTGNPHYPSARAAFHRISGHLELSKRSTQNQLRIALRDKLKITDDKDLHKLTIKMHHFPIEGFIKITDTDLTNETMSQLVRTEKYEAYKVIQQKVLALENALIYELKDKLLNKTNGVAQRYSQIPFSDIYKSIIELVSHG